MIRDQIQELRDMVESQALTTGQEFTLASGGKSSYYLDCRAVTMRLRGRFLIRNILSEDVKKRYPDVKAVGGVATGAIATAALLADALATDMFYVRSASKDHGTRKLVEGAGHLEAGSRVVLVEDVVTTGGSLIRALKALKDIGLDPVAAYVLVDRSQEPKWSLDIEGTSVRYHPVFLAKEPGEILVA